jgi:excinuclease ABC subunit C
MTHFLRQIYDATDPQDIPKQVFVGSTPADHSVLEDWLGQVRGSTVRLTIPQRGPKVSLLETVLTNAHETLMQHQLRRASDLTSRSAALSSLQTALGLVDPPLRIECIDISHLQGTSSVGSLVVFEDGLAKKSHYRRFTIKDVEGSDDVASIKEVVRRRFSHPDTSSGFAYEPGLLVVDGGQPQAKAAQEVLLELGMSHIPVIGLAKRLEEVWPAGVAHPVILSRGSDALFLLQRVRDEAHRFAISFHRQKRSKAMTASELDRVPGLGQVKRTALVKKFRSLRAIKAASVTELQAVAGIGPTLAMQIYRSLQDSEEDARTSESAPAGINTSTGEIMET